MSEFAGCFGGRSKASFEASEEGDGTDSSSFSRIHFARSPGARASGSRSPGATAFRRANRLEDRRIAAQCSRQFGGFVNDHRPQDRHRVGGEARSGFRQQKRPGQLLADGDRPIG